MAPADATMVWLMALLGLRWGEAAAIRVRSIEFGNPSVLAVTETVQRGVGGRGFVGPPKSDAGRRRLTMPRALSDLLAAQLADRGLTAADAEELVFVNSAGELWDATNWRRRIWQPAAIDAGLGAVEKVDGARKYEGITPHDLRRTNATALVGADVDIKTAQARLGHSDVRMTLDVYARVLAERDQGAADAVADALMPDRTSSS
jgi:integrase